MKTKLLRKLRKKALRNVKIIDIYTSNIYDFVRVTIRIDKYHNECENFPNTQNQKNITKFLESCRRKYIIDLIYKLKIKKYKKL